MDINQTALDATAFFVIFGATGFMFVSFAIQVLRLAKAFQPVKVFNYPLMTLAVFSASIQAVASKNRLDEYSLGSGLATFGASAAIGLGLRPACAAMIMMIAAFNTVRPTQKRVTRSV